jgi:predicted SAM-dependent methyltransferase
MNFDAIISLLNQKSGIEFGGPTELFSFLEHRMPIYYYTNLDGGNIFENNHFQRGFTDDYNYLPKKTGTQFNVDCTNEEDLKKINKKYDFILTSHVIEHIANPIKTIKLWSDLLLNESGYILSIMPDYRFCFDRKRPLTTIDHIKEDYNNNVSEDDTTHIEEQKQLHDWSLGGHKEFYMLCENNYQTRVVHHHTFTEETVKELLSESGFETLISFKSDDLNIVNLSVKRK